MTDRELERLACAIAGVVVGIVAGVAIAGPGAVIPKIGFVVIALIVAAQVARDDRRR